jgi:hypothetical protein
MANVVRLFVLDDCDNRIGVFVLDMDALITMYQQRVQTTGTIPEEWGGADISGSSVALPPPLANWEWYNDEEGNLCLRFKRGKE